MSNLTLGSLFSGSGGFELAGMLCGIEPLWASEVEPFPIRVTMKRIPQVIHFGDINKINGANVPPVDIITGGFCCQDLSVAGKRAGLHGERSGLFFQIIRIIKEMHEATNNEYPKYAVLENVPGMYSSNNGLDFLEVLNELIKIKDETLSVPMPESGRWSTAGCIVGDGFSVAYRTLDAQHWGVAQRRRRCYIVVDFTGERAGEILFDESRLRGNPPQSGFARQGTAGGAEAGVGNSIAFEPGAVSRLGGHCWNEHTGTLRADAGDNLTAVVYDARGNGSGEIVNTITGDHENRITDYTALVMNERQYAMTVGEGVANTLTGTDHKGTQCLLQPKTLKIRSGCPGGGKGVLVQNDKSATLSCNNDQTVFVPKAYGICSQESNSMKSPNPRSGIYEAETSRTIDCNAVNPSANQGGIAVVSVQGNMIGRKPENGPKGSGVSDDVSFTLTEADRHGIAYAMTTGGFPEIHEEQTATLMARDYKDPQIVSRPQYVVRRLTPTECALLQGFPPDWCSGLETPEPTEDDIVFWSEVWETHRRITGTSSKPKSRNQIIKWLKNPHSDSAEYKMWGNGVCLPVVVMVLSGIVVASNGGFEEKMTT